jgi:hypothetical protein
VKPLTKPEVWSLTTRHAKYAELSPLAAKVLAVLFGAAGSPDPDLWHQAKLTARLRMATVAERVGRGVSTVRAAVAELERADVAGWVSRVRTGRSNVFVLTLPGRVRVVADRQPSGGQTASIPAVRPPRSQRSTIQSSAPEPPLQSEGVSSDRLKEAREFAAERGASDVDAYAAAVLASGRPFASEAGKRRRAAEDYQRRLTAIDRATAERRATATGERIPTAAELIAAHGRGPVLEQAERIAASAPWHAGGLERPSVRARIAAELEAAGSVDQPALIGGGR